MGVPVLCDLEHEHTELERIPDSVPIMLLQTTSPVVSRNLFIQLQFKNAKVFCTDYGTEKAAIEFHVSQQVRDLL